MPTNSTSFYVNLAGNITNQARRFGQSIRSMSESSSRSLTRLKSTVSSVSASIDKIGNRAFIGITAGGALAARSLIKTAAEFEMAGIRMKQTFGDDGDRATEWLKKFATDTPMAFGDVQDAMMRLKTAGIDPMNGSLQALVDYNAKVGGNADNLNGYIAALSKGFIKGKLSMEEINPLLERNVKVFEILAAETGGKYTADQMQKMLSQGKLGRKAIQALLRGMGKDAQGSAKEQMKTWDGLVSNLGDTFTAMQARFMEKGVFDELKNELGGILDWLNQKMDNGEFDELAQKVNDTLVSALHELRDTAKDVKPALESIGSVIEWLSDKAGGYGNLAKFVAAFYATNKVARSGLGQLAGKGMWGLGRWSVGKFKRKPTSDSIGGALGGVTGVTPVYVTNFADMGFGAEGSSRGRRNRTRRTSSRSVRPRPSTTNRGGMNSVQNVTKSIKNTAENAIKSTSKVVAGATKSITKGVTRGVPLLGTGLAIAEGAMTIMDDSATVQEKSESIGSIAGATAGAIIGQALIPVPVVGAAIGGAIGDWLGGWLGSEVGEKLASPEPQETKLDGSIEVKIRASDGLVASVGNTSVSSNVANALHIATTTGYMGVGF